MTELVYMNDFDVMTCEAVVSEVGEHEGKSVVVLDRTCFYPRGGGQDFDQGLIKSANAEFSVEAVFFVDGSVKHIGEYNSGTLSVGDQVACFVETERRSLNTKLHSAGHVVDMAVRSLGWGWVPGKGAHYPHMSFVEYTGNFSPENKAEYEQQLQEAATKLVSAGSQNSIQFMEPEEMARAGAVIPENLPKNKPARAVLYDDFIVPCGGTHVRNVHTIGNLLITKIKLKDGNIRVSYTLG